MTASAPVKLKITPENVRAAYVEKGLTPMRSEWGVQLGAGGVIVATSGACCALGAMLVNEPCPMMYRDALQRRGFNLNKMFDAVFDVDWHWFYRGFDGIRYENIPEGDAQRSYELGRMCWVAVADLAPAEATFKEEASC